MISRGNETPTERDPSAVEKASAITPGDQLFLAWQRTQLANERTFLAWARTSVSLIAVGFVIERFELLLQRLLAMTGSRAELASYPQMTYLSLFCFFVAGVAILVAGLRFVQVRRHMSRGEARFSVLPDVLIILSVTAVIIMVIVLSLPHLLAMGGIWP